jgi:hypothetical protein
VDHVEHQHIFRPPIEIRSVPSIESQEYPISKERVLVSRSEVLGADEDPQRVFSSINVTENASTQPSPRRVSALSSYDGMSARIAGDPHSHEHFLWDEKDECSVSHLTYRRMPAKHLIPNNSSPALPPQLSIGFVVGGESLGRTGEPRIEGETLNIVARDLACMFTDDQKARLVKLFFEYVYPYFPILSEGWFLTPEIPLIA